MPIIDRLLKSCLLWPLEIAEVDDLNEICGDTKTEAVNVAVHMHDVKSRDYAGK
jgi:hypothetical protein